MPAQLFLTSPCSLRGVLAVSLEHGTLNVSEYVVGRSWYPCPRVGLTEAPLFTRDGYGNREEIPALPPGLTRNKLRDIERTRQPFHATTHAGSHAGPRR